MGSRRFAHVALLIPLVAGLLLVIREPVAHSQAGAGISYPLKVGPTKRYLVDQRGRPFMIVGDSPQALIANLSLSDAKTFIADRAAAGFNSLWINLLCDRYTGGRADGSTYDHIVP